MAGTKFSSAGVYAAEIDLSGPRTLTPTGVPAGIIGTALKGPAFVPVTVGIDSDFYAIFGKTDGKKFGPLAMVEWLKNARAGTYLKVLGIGTGERRTQNGSNVGSVTGAGFLVGDQLPSDSTGALVDNPYANLGGPPGRLYFLGALMSESLGSSFFSEAALQGPAGQSAHATASIPIVRGVIMAASGVLLRVSSSVDGTNSAPTSIQLGTDAVSVGRIVGAVKLLDGGVSKQEFVMLLNGHKGTDPQYPNILTASFDITSPNYFANVLNRDPYKLNQAGHLLYANYDIHNVQAVVTGTGIVVTSKSAGGGVALGFEEAVFITSGSAARNVGSSDIPNYENWQDRYSAGKTPWIISQKFGGISRNLFRFVMLDDGASNADRVKISIESITPSTDPRYLYGTFDVVIRDWSDRDTDLRVIEAYRGVNLDPSSDRYIGKAIGDQRTYYDWEHVSDAQKLVIDGDFPNKSNLVRIEVVDQIKTQEMDSRALPVGFRGAPHLITSGSAVAPGTSTSHVATGSTTSYMQRCVQPPIPMRPNITAGSGASKVVNSSYYWGVQFEQVTSIDTPNASTSKNKTITSLTKYFPNFQATNADVIAEDNTGAPDTTALGIVDVDRFNKNLFSLENIQVITNSAGDADPAKWVSALYVRNGSIGVSDTAKTRAFIVDDLAQQSNRRFGKFSLFLQGGFDGTLMFDQDASEMTNVAVSEEMANTNRGLTLGPTVKSFKRAVDIMQNTTDVDVMLLSIPGIRNPIVTDYAIGAVEDRFDALLIMDIEEHDTHDLLITSSNQQSNVQFTANNFANRGLDSSFAAAYYPDVIMTDPNTKTNIVVPPSVAVLGAFSVNDALAHPWFAPAGFARGALVSTLETSVKLSKDNMDALYEVDINPLVAFPGSAPTGASPTPGGVVVWGQKTLQQAASALDRVNVRRLLIEVRRLTREVANKIIFEQNREATLARFAAEINPRLAKVQAQGGIDRFLVRIDTTTTTQNDVDNNTIRGRIFVQPTKAIEYVSLDFVVSNAGGTR